MGFYNKFGLINAIEDEDVSENCLPFSVENCILLELLGQCNTELSRNIHNYIKLLKNEQTGMYNNIPEVKEGRDAYTSHDQLTSICAFSAANGFDYHEKVWKGIKFGTYDNITGKFNIKRILHPRDYIYIGYLNDNILCKLLFHLFCIITILSFIMTTKVRPTFWERLKSGFRLQKQCIKKTDGQLLSLIRAYGLQTRSKLFNFTWKICLKIADKTFDGGFKGIFSTYFRSETHPNRVLSLKINNYIIRKKI